MSWNYRVLKHHGEEDWLAIHEVYYDEEDKPCACTGQPIEMTGTDLQELEWQLQKMQKALKKPIIDYDDF